MYLIQDFPLDKCESFGTTATEHSTIAKAHACTFAIVRACTLTRVHASTIVIVHACNLALVHANT